MNETTMGAGDPNTPIDETLGGWLKGLFAKAFPDCDQAAVAGRVVPSARPEFGDFQCQDAMPLAKALHQNPRAIAAKVVDGAAFEGVVSKVEIAGAGFINIFLDSSYIAKCAAAVGADDVHSGIPQIGTGLSMVIDYSSPNVAKPMHIGHIRSTVIGGAIDSLHRAVGYNVIADNHIGDWGTQFGIIIRGYREFLDSEALKADPIEELQRIYVKSYSMTKLPKELAEAAEANPAVKDSAEYKAAEAAASKWLDECRLETVKLQQGEPENRALWQEFIRLSKRTFDDVYDRLGIHFDTTRGESYYQDQLAGIVEGLEKAGLAHESDGATIVDLSSEGLDVAIVRKRDGGFNYTTTDLATVATRERDYSPKKIVYVTDERQQLHFKQFFNIARKMGYVSEDCALEHVWFGLMRMKEGTISTRQGNLIKLSELLDEAHRRALEIVRRNHPEYTDAEADSLAEKIGAGAVKYADLSQDPKTLITFSWDKAMSLEGNSGPYLQYAYARIQSVLDKYREAFPNVNPDDFDLVLADPVERDLALKIATFPAAVVRAASTYRPCVLADHLYALSQCYSSFYQRLPFLKAEQGIRESRIRLCGLVAKVLSVGLGILGLETPDRM